MSLYSIKDTTLTAIGDAIREKTGSADTYKPTEMATAIQSITTGGGGEEAFEPVVLSASQSYGCAGLLAAYTIEKHGDKISTESLTDINYMFLDSPLTKIPFALNCKAGASNINSSSVFSGCGSLVKAPAVNDLVPNTVLRFFGGCYNLKDLSELNAESWDWTYIKGSGYRQCGEMFYGCYSLREIPQAILTGLFTNSLGTSSTYSAYNQAFLDCYNLDKVLNLGVTTATLTSNVFKKTFNNNWCLKRFTFQTNEDGTPKTANWKNQEIDLTMVGGCCTDYSWYLSYVPKYAPERAGKLINSLETYELYKDDPDAYAAAYRAADGYPWSLYNHDSAVETINSLPDCSASGGTNTIKFKGTMGSGYGKAISDLTEAEKAVATAKGWTVSIT